MTTKKNTNAKKNKMKAATKKSNSGNTSDVVVTLVEKGRTPLVAEVNQGSGIVTGITCLIEAFSCENSMLPICGAPIGSHEMAGNYTELWQENYFEGTNGYVGSTCNSCGVKLIGKASISESGKGYTVSSSRKSIRLRKVLRRDAK